MVLRRTGPTVAFLLLLAAVATHAQVSFQCTASSTSVVVRAEGLAELVGDLILTCTGGTAGQPLTVNVQVFANTNITSRILEVSTNTTEAVLGVDGPPYGPTTIFAGRLLSKNALIFQRVTFTQPGSGTRTLRIMNVRVNATMLPLASAVTLFVTASGETSIPITNPRQDVAVVQTGMSMEVRKPDDSGPDVPRLLTCTGNNTTLLTGGDYPSPPAPGGRTFNLKFTERFSNAFREQAGENGTNDPTWPAPLNKAGLADHGTRLRAVFTGIPAGVVVFVTVRQVREGTTGVEAECVTTPGGPGLSCPLSSPADGGLYRVPASGEVYWEIRRATAAAAESVSFGVAIAYNPGAASGMGQVLGSFSPISTAGEATPGPNDLPRFVSTASPVPAFTLEPCRTVLLFQYVTAVDGFDTGIAVTNTTADSPVFNTPGQSGKCKAYFYQAGATVPPLESPVLPPGGQWVWVLSSQRPGFQGYMLVSCEFQHAYGYAFISDLGLSGPDRFAQGYQAIVLTDRDRQPGVASSSSVVPGSQGLAPR